MTEIIEEMSEYALICSGIESIGNLSLSENIQTLNLHGNLLRNLEGLRCVPMLTTLNLSSNEISSSNLPQLALLPSLISLDLAGNKLNSIIDFPYLPSLRTLSLAYNQLSNLEG